MFAAPIRKASAKPAPRARPAAVSRSPEPMPIRPMAVSPDFGTVRISARSPAIPTAPIQAKLAVGRTDDPLEHEADRVAEQVVRMTAPPAGGNCAACQAEEREPVRAKPAAGLALAAEAPDSIHEALGAPGRPLDAAARAYFEPRFGRDFGAVRIHDDARAAESAMAIGARAYTRGRDIVFARNHYAPRTSDGRLLLAHELTHVVQQSGSAGAAAEAGGRDVAISRSGNQDAVARKPYPPCGPSGRAPGSSAFQGTAEHIAIENDFLAVVAPGTGIVEYTIPESSALGNTGFADMVDVGKHMIYEIKPMTQAGKGLIEVERYVAMANKHCPPFAWRVGTDYPPRMLPFNAGWLSAQQVPYLPGLVIYERLAKDDPALDPQKVPLPQTDKKLEKKQKPVEQPVTQPIPATSMDMILEFIDWAVKTAQDAEKACQDFLDKHPELAELIATASVIIFVATIIEDIVTLGAGLADDPATIAIAWKLWDLAMVMIERRALKEMLRPRIPIKG